MFAEFGFAVGRYSMGEFAVGGLLLFGFSGIVVLSF